MQIRWNFKMLPNRNQEATIEDWLVTLRKRVLDIHHILPLSSGTRVDSKKGTMLEDLVPICPTCHRAIHRYYDDYLKNGGRKDFDCESEARVIYMRAKENIGRGDCYA